MKNLNIPNRLSILRMCLVPVCVLLLYLPGQTARTAALIVFCIAAFTDFLDGQIARRQHIVTTFGKFIDPVADKLLVLSTMIALCGLGAIVLPWYRVAPERAAHTPNGEAVDAA